MKVNDDAHLIETKVSSELVFDGKLLHVRRDTVKLPDGSLATREYVVHPGAVLIVPVLLSYGGIENGIRKRLDGLDHVMSPAGILPDQRIVTWILASAKQ